MPRGALFAALALLLGLGAVSALAEEQVVIRLEHTHQELDAHQRAIVEAERTAVALSGKAADIRKELISLRATEIEAARRAQALEGELTAIETRIQALDRDRQNKYAALQSRQYEGARALGAMQRLARLPAEAVFLVPRSLIDASRAQLLLASVTRGLDEDAHAIVRSLAEIENLSGRIAMERATLAERESALTAQRTELARLIENKKALIAVTENAQKAAQANMARLANEAADLQELITRLALDKGTEPSESVSEPGEEEVLAALPPIAKPETAAPSKPAETPAETLVKPKLTPHAAKFARGALVLPAEGRIVSRFGDETAPGITTKGLSIETRYSAQVIAPFDGKVAFAGAFRDYGQLLIIAHDGGYHSLLAGLGQIDVRPGQVLVAGEPVGTMESSSVKHPQLYLELRHKGRPVNPLPWLAVSDSKASGS